jgi:hypothetical protein
MGLRIRLRYWLALLSHALGAPARYIERRESSRRAHELAMVTLQAQMQQQLLQGLAASNAEMVKQLAAPLTANATVLTEWIQMFKTTAVPTAQVITETHELGWERDEAEAVLEKGRIEDRELFKAAWPEATDGRMSPPIGPDFGAF